MPTQLKNDVFAGFSVFLLALPLCLGIALASGFPAVSGILSAIVGGLIASFFGGAQLSIKGPAAGLIVIALGAITQLGYEATLAVGVVAACIQILIGVTRKAIIAEVMPPAVIHGMLAAIGIIIVSQQAYVMMGLTPEHAKPLELLWNLPFAIGDANPIIFGLGVLALVIAIIWPLLKKVAFIPSTIVILLITIPLSLYFNLNITDPELLINIPSNILGALAFPDFSMILSPISIKYIIMFALVGSIESLLTVCAIDSIARQTHHSDLNKDLRAVGMGNLASSLIGGLPMISEIVRSKANIDYGATSIRANFFHGLFMLIAVIIFPSVMNLIPLSALAALLIFVGLKLAAPTQFVHAYTVGKDQLAIFLVTLFVTLFTDLLIGVLTGVILKLVIHMARGNNLMQLFSPITTVQKSDDTIHIIIDGPLTFLGYMKLRNIIAKASKEASHIIVDLDAITYLDYTVFNKIQTLPNEFEGVQISIEGNQELSHFYRERHNRIH
ncbi:MAG: SulP family inorganic anion transporter [Legionellales bacterium]|jgi:MFS superfamily sulfate permease-like transporter